MKESNPNTSGAPLDETCPSVGRCTGNRKCHWRFSQDRRQSVMVLYPVRIFTCSLGAEVTHERGTGTS